MKRVLGYCMFLFCLCVFLLVFTACGTQVRFHLNFVVDGEIYDTIDTAGQEAISMPKNPTKAGDEFDGWYWDEGTWERPFTANSLLDTPLSSDLSVYAKWKSNDVQKVDPSAALIVSAPAFEINGNALSLTLPNATESYSFLGQITVSTGATWQISTDMQGLNAIPTKTVPLNPGDNTFYLLVVSANGEGVSLYTVTIRRRPIYTVSFNANGGNSVTALRAEEDSTITPPKTTRTGYSFAGWDYDFTQPIKGNLTTAAKWTSNTDTSYTVEYYLQNKGATGYDLAERVPLMGTTASTVTAEQKTYPHFTYKASGSTKTGTIVPDGSLVLKLYYTRDTYTVTFVGNGGTLESGNATQTVRYGNAATTPTFARKGYTFAGWDKESNAISEDLTITAEWEINHYSITYNLNDGINAESNPATYTVEDTVVLTAPKRTGYTFEGWSDNGTIAVGSIGEKTFTAKWKTITYTISYDLGGGANAGTNPSSYTIEDDVILAMPIRKGYTFAGWSDNGKIDAGTIGDKTFTASWEIATYSVIYYVNGGETVANPATYRITDDAPLAEPTWAYGRFLGWYTASDEKIVNLQGYAGDLSLTAKWECYFTLSGNSITDVSTYCKNNVTEIVIPTSLNGTTITGIAANAFANYTGLTSVTIPDSVTSIGAGAFRGCSALQSITIPFVGGSRKTASDTYQYPFGYIFGTRSYTGGVATKQYYYGSSTSSTTNATYYIPSSLKSVTVTGGYIPYGAFYNCSGLTSVTIGNGVTSIGNYAFYGCSGLTSITIPSCVTSIENSAFYGCTRLIEVHNLSSLNIQKGSTNNGYAGYYAERIYSSGESYLHQTDDGFTFYENGNEVYLMDYSGSLTSLILPNTYNGKNYAIYTYAFNSCFRLTSVIIPDGVTSIGDEAFRGCSGLTAVYYTGDIAGWCGIAFGSYDANPLYYAHNLYINDELVTELVIPDNVTSIGDWAFSYCSGLTSVTIGNGVTSIRGYAFRDCTGLTGVYYTGDVAGWCGIAFGSNDANPLCYAHNLYINGELVTDLVIPNGVTSIGAEAFYNCSKLTSVTIPDSVTSIGKGAFSGCSSLRSITIPFVGAQAGKTASDTYQYPFGYIFGTRSYTGGVATKQYYYGSSTSSTTNATYYIPSSLKSVTVTGGYIPYGAFNNCSGLTSVTIGNGVTSIGDWAFSYCSGLTSVTIPDGVTSIGDWAFSYCSGLTSITILDSVTSIGGSAFYSCTGLTSITIPDSVTSIGNSAFSGCSGLTSITIPDSVTSIGGSAFSYCTGLTSITIPDSVTSIGEWAFSGCTRLTSITIPDSVTSIGQGAFGGCSSLASITIPFVGESRKTASQVYQYPFGYIFGTSSYTGGVATNQYYYGSSTSSTTSNTYYIPSSLKSVTVTGGAILYGAFSNCAGLTSVTIENGITIIEGCAFLHCTDLTSVIIPETVMSIGARAFENCTGLNNVTIPNNVTDIGKGAFKNCDNLIKNEYDNAFYLGNESNPHFVLIQAKNSSITSCVIHPQTRVIYDSAFSDCGSLTIVSFPDSITSIGPYAFRSCKGLTSITIPDKIKTIGDYAFSDCSNLTSISIPNSVKSIGICTFRNCSALTSVTIGNGIVQIGDDAFYGCNNLQYSKYDNAYYLGNDSNPYIALIKVITNSITSCSIHPQTRVINAGAFGSCAELSTITIPNSVISIGAFAFYRCSNLVSVTIPESINLIENSAFYGCTGLTSVTYQDTTSKWNAIRKGSNWNDETGSYIIHCTDGDL